MRKIRLLEVLLISLFSIAGTASAEQGNKNGNNNENEHNSRTFVARMTGAQETPPVQTDAHGLSIFQVSRDGLSLRYLVVATDIISVTAGHIHSGTVGLAGPVVLPLVSTSACTTRGDTIWCQGTATAANLTGPLAGHPLSDLVALMRAGHAYSNVHTTAHPGGEIRGQIGGGHGEEDSRTLSASHSKQ
jgi:hypothetical protein